MSKKRAINPRARELGKRLHALRKSKGWTQQDLADKAKLGCDAVGSYERGARMPRNATVDSLAGALGVTFESLMERLPASTSSVEEVTVPESTDVYTRIARAEVTWTRSVTQVTRRILRDEAIVVLAPRRGGSSTFARQLAKHLATRYSSWTVNRFSARPDAGESVEQYMARMREYMPVAEEGARLVVCIYDFSRTMVSGALSPHVSALGNQLRAYLEGSGVRRKFSLVAVGGYPLYLLRHGEGDLSALNRACEESLPGLSQAQIADLMAQVEPGRFSSTDAAKVAKCTGGHPHLVKALLGAWYRAGDANDAAPAGSERWQQAERALEEDADYLHPTLAAIAANGKYATQLRTWLNAPKVRRKIKANWPGQYLLYSGLLRQQGQDLYLRCPAVERLVRRELLDETE